MDDIAKSAAHWDAHQEWRLKQPDRIRWWESEAIWRSINHRVCGKAIPGGHAGLFDLLESKVSDLPLARAVSVGCGSGLHEMELVRRGLAGHFDLYDISQELVSAGRAHAEATGIGDKCSFMRANAFAEPPKPVYDLVFWGSALHHMPSAEDAVKWSYDSLRPGGWFLMTEYVGANRFQWSRATVSLVNLFRATLPQAVFRNDRNPTSPYKRFFNAPTLDDMAYDPSEAMDSEAIIPAVKKHFSRAEIKNIGGTIYHLGLEDILTNIPEDSRTLRYAICWDWMMRFIPNLAVAIAQKPS